MNSFENLSIHRRFIDKLKERSIAEPTAIQNLVIPALFAGKNIIFRSATGTGKTFAYLLPALQSLAEENNADAGGGPAVLICAPTLELCSQIKTEAEFLMSPVANNDKFAEVNCRTALLTGSVKIDRQIELLKKNKPAVAAGNPGRLLVLAKMGKLKLRNLKYLVLDEADRLTVKECLEETKELLKIIERETKNRTEKKLCLAACSATVGKKICSQLGQLFSSAELIESSDHEILRERIEHWAFFSEKRRRVQTLRSLLAALKNKPSKSKKHRIKALVFTSKGDEAGKILSQLQYHHIPAAGLFGKMNKKPLTSTERKEALDLFRDGRIETLVSTDLAARGLDVQDVTHVIALDVPQDSENYIHRCGRTGRAGKRGIMVTIGDETQMRLLASLEKKLKIKVMPKELYGGQICAPVLD
ncbi:MAG: DEAD/DEAH box helicase [Spirochaetes bacterium]|nr:DEAD/DEAH box helicase [Spirochaetota bacterium]